MEEQVSDINSDQTKESSNSNGLIIAAAILAGSLIFSGVYYSTHGGLPIRNQLGNGNNAPQAQQNAPVDMAKLSEGYPTLGDKNAPVTVVEFSDFQCPFCHQFEIDTFPQIKQAYIDTGKVKFVYRNFPLTIHNMAESYAEAAECANEQGEFWEMHDKIFAAQDGEKQFTIDDLKAWGKELGLKESQFNSCLDSKKYTNEITQDVKEGDGAGVQGTPTFFINGKMEVGALPFSVFQADIDAALK